MEFVMLVAVRMLTKDCADIIKVIIDLQKDIGHGRLYIERSIKLGPRLWQEKNF